MQCCIMHGNRSRLHILGAKLGLFVAVFCLLVAACLHFLGSLCSRMTGTNMRYAAMKLAFIMK